MLDGRGVLVTGGSSGIGRSIADGLRDAGATVAVVDGPLTSRAEAEQAFADAAPTPRAVHAVVHALADPAAFVPTPLAETDAAGWDVRCEAVLRTALWCCQAAFSRMADGGGRLVLMTPTVGLTGAAELVPYATAVEGMRALAKSAARQWGGRGITVNCVAPPIELVADEAAQPPVGGWALGHPPGGRADIAPVVALLAGEAAHSVTGTTITVDGGVVMAP